MIFEISPIGERIYDLEETEPRIGMDHVKPLMNLLRDKPNSGLAAYLRKAVPVYHPNLRKNSTNGK